MAQLNHNAYLARFSPSGHRFVTAAMLGTARVWDTATGAEAAEVSPLEDKGGLHDARDSPDGRRIATANGRNGDVRVWNAESGKPITPLLKHGGRVRYLHIGPDGRQLLTCCRDGTVRIWDLATKARSKVPLRTINRRVRYAVPSPTGSGVLVSSRWKARIWDTKSGRPLSNSMRHDVDTGEGPDVLSLFSPDGRRIPTRSLDGSARLWNAADGKPIGIPLRHEGIIWDAMFSADGSRVATADGTARLWDAASGRVDSVFQQEHGINALSISSDGRRLVTGGGLPYLGELRVWDVKTGRLEHQLTGRPRGVLYVHFSPDGDCIVSADMSGKVLVWNATAGQSIASMEHKSWITGTDFSPDGQRVVTASLDTTARIWSASTGAPTTPLLIGGELNGAVDDPKDVVVRLMIGRLTVTLGPGLVLVAEQCREQGTAHDHHLVARQRAVQDFDLPALGQSEFHAAVLVLTRHSLGEHIRWG